MKAIIDTNGLLNSVPNNGSKRWLYDAFISKKFEWVFSNEIISEYAEMIGSKFGEDAVEVVLPILLAATNTIRYEPYFKWKLVIDDPEDNKFVDCAIGANVDYLVSDDRHLIRLRNIERLFPPVSVIKFDEFKEVLGIK